MRSILILFLLINTIIVNAQKTKFGIAVGINAGAPVPKKIDKNATGKPGIHPTIGITLSKKITPKLNLNTTLFYEQKSAAYTSPVKYPYIVISGDSIDSFSGIVDGKFKNHYLTLPIEIAYQLHKKWTIGTGIYAAYLLKGNNSGIIKNGKAGFNGMFAIDNQTYDESKNIHKLDAGIKLSTRYTLHPKINLQWQTTYGITSLTKPTDNFKDKIHNVYTYLTAVYYL